MPRWVRDNKSYDWICILVLLSFLFCFGFGAGNLFIPCKRFRSVSPPMPPSNVLPVVRLGVLSQEWAVQAQQLEASCDMDNHENAIFSRERFRSACKQLTQHRAEVRSSSTLGGQDCSASLPGAVRSLYQSDSVDWEALSEAQSQPQAVTPANCGAV